MHHDDESPTCIPTNGAGNIKMKLYPAQPQLRRSRILLTLLTLNCAPGGVCCLTACFGLILRQAQDDRPL
jgi:hypothetical protein